MLKRMIIVVLAGVFTLSLSSVSFAQNADEILNSFSNEPSIEQTQEAAIQHAGFGVDRLEKLYTRAGVSKVLPKSLTYSFRYKDEDRERKQVDYTDKTTASGSQEITEKTSKYEQPTDTMQHDVKAQWDLAGLVYNPEQLRVVSEMGKTAKLRDSLLSSVTKVYFARRKAQIKLLTEPPQEVTQRLNMQLSIQEYTANLDALTGGWFSKNVQK